jgi:hypothetical protein
MLHRAHVLMPVTTETNVAVYKTGCPIGVAFHHFPGCDATVVVAAAAT